METVQRAINSIGRVNPWLGRVANRLNKHYSDTLPNGQSNPTMATNGKALFINPDYAKSLPMTHLKGVLVHEVTHVIQRHSLRRGERDPQLYNQAADHATNSIVRRLGYSLPSGALDPIDNWTVEEIYRHIAQDQPEQDANSESGDDSSGGDADTSHQGADSQQDTENAENSADEGEAGQPGNTDSSESSSDNGESGESGESGSPSGNPAGEGIDLLDYPLEPGQSIQDAEREIDQLMAEAQLDLDMAEERAGHVESNVFQHVFEPVDTDLNWVRELEEYVNLIGGADYSMSPPHIGLLSQGIICNQLNPSGCGNVILAVDVSGSINRNKLNLALTHLQLFVENIDYESLRVIACSSQVRFDETFYRGETVDISNMACGGGTKFSPVFDLIAEGTEPDLLIYFSDMQVYAHDSPADDPGYPIIWLVDNNSAMDDSGEWIDRRSRYSDHHWFRPDFGKRINATQ